MKGSEVNKVLKIISQADHGCPYCVKELIDLFILEFPEHKDIIDVYLEQNSEKFAEIEKIMERTDEE